jgi:hypothetical protein
MALVLAFVPHANAQNFSCRIGTSPACLDYGDQVCSSNGKCVDANAVCFDSYQCGYEGFTCRSNVTECADKYDLLLNENNDLVSEYNDLLARAKRAQSDADDAERCVRWASTLDEAQGCY